MLLIRSSKPPRPTVRFPNRLQRRGLGSVALQHFSNSSRDPCKRDLPIQEALDQHLVGRVGRVGRGGRGAAGFPRLDHAPEGGVARGVEFPEVQSQVRPVQAGCVQRAVARA